MRYVSMIAALMIVATAAMAETTASLPADVAAMQALEPHQRWDSPQWLRERATILDTAGNCQARWNLLWNWAKRGNLEARHLLLENESGTRALFTRTPLTPDTENDRLWLRVLLAIHQLGYVGRSEASADTARRSLDYIGTWKQQGVSAFSACYTSSPDADCTAIAVSQGMVPSFASYAASVDARIQAGAVPVCTGNSAP